ncbi:PspC domain-containing protein [Mesonia aquimarina]|uniref:PspC domain-containing protein n=1 Tax=Mesonia aquimarina TaxID=1504967 RepID=UPI000EF5E921|nr:PspC domain-containing protein [Mesonia aquimarina]
MNKTVNINLAGIFFHIDEDAFLKLKSYLDAIKHSLTDAQGREEIIRDIEARIAELFTEKMKENQDVVSVTEVEAVIEIMGQPEDYKIDDEIFEDEADQTSYASKTSKKLYRDTDHSYVAGVSSGLGHFFKIDAIWVRILFILLTVLSSGGFILAYILFWIFVPEATTTAEKLEMRGEPINISNIERKVREGFDNVSEKVKDVDYKKYGEKVNAGASGFFKSLGNFILNVFKIIAKIVGVFIIIFSGAGLIGLLFSFLSIGTFGVFDAPWLDYVELANIGVPFWLACLLLFLAAGIPLFFLFILGLKILINQLKSIGTPAKLVLLGVWLLSIFVISFLGIRQATERAFDGKVIQTETLPITSQDTLYVKMKGSNFYGESTGRDYDMQIRHNEEGEKVIYNNSIRLIIKSTKEENARIEITKMAEGKSDQDARKYADAINYETSFRGNTLYLNDFLTTKSDHSFRDQHVKITLFLPEGSTFFAHQNTYSFHRSYDYYNDILENGQEEQYLKVIHQDLICINCIDEEEKNFSNRNENFIKEKLKTSEEIIVEEIKNDDDWYQAQPRDTIQKIKQDSTKTE